MSESPSLAASVGGQDFPICGDTSEVSGMAVAPESVLPINSKAKTIESEVKTVIPIAQLLLEIHQSIKHPNNTKPTQKTMPFKNSQSQTFFPQHPLHNLQNNQLTFTPLLFAKFPLSQVFSTSHILHFHLCTTVGIFFFPCNFLLNDDEHDEHEERLLTRVGDGEYDAGRQAL